MLPVLIRASFIFSRHIRLQICSEFQTRKKFVKVGLWRFKQQHKSEILISKQVSPVANTLKIWNFQDFSCSLPHGHHEFISGILG
jgi:hypothetical protein